MPWRRLHGSSGMLDVIVPSAHALTVSLYRIMVTFALVVVFFRGVSSQRRGDGFRGQLVA